MYVNVIRRKVNTSRIMELHHDNNNNKKLSRTTTIGMNRVFSEILPNLYIVHLYAIAAMFIVMCIGCFITPMIDLDTLKPNQDFPIWLKTLSYYTNIPIKLGVLHFILYSLEYHIGEYTLFQRHIGQRLTTMWMQFFENPRWGQHIHMQTETLLQILDILVRYNSSSGKKLGFVERVVLGSMATTMIFTNFVTSMGYHTKFEQILGFLLMLIKVLLMDYAYGVHFNEGIGATYSKKRNLLGGLLFVGIFLTIAYYLNWIDYVVHPTALATILYIACKFFDVYKS